MRRSSPSRFICKVFFAGSLTVWQDGQPHDNEVIATFESRWDWLARARGLAAIKNLNTGRCGLIVVDKRIGRLTAHVPATATTVEPL